MPTNTSVGESLFSHIGAHPLISGEFPKKDNGETHLPGMKRTKSDSNMLRPTTASKMKEERDRQFEQLEKENLTVDKKDEYLVLLHDSNRGTDSADGSEYGDIPRLTHKPRLKIGDRVALMSTSGRIGTIGWG
jgi:hypothetical protein